MSNPFLLQDDGDITSNPFRDNTDSTTITTQTTTRTPHGTNQRELVSPTALISVDSTETLAEPPEPPQHRYGEEDLPESDVVQDEIDRYKSHGVWQEIPFQSSLPSNNNGSPFGPTSDADIARREQDLIEREEAILQREQDSGLHPKLNFPPFYAMLAHYPDADIPENSKVLQRNLYRSLVLTLIQVIANFALFFVMLIERPSKANAGIRDFIVSGIDGTHALLHYLLLQIVVLSFASSYWIGFLCVNGWTLTDCLVVFLCPFLALVLWYKPVYYALKTSTNTRTAMSFSSPKSLYLVIFFIFYSIHVVWQTWKVIGFPGSGSGGLLIFIGCVTSAAVLSSILSALTLGLWATGLALSVAMWKQTWNHWTTGGCSISEAKREFAFRGAFSWLKRDQSSTEDTSLGFKV